MNSTELKVKAESDSNDDSMSPEKKPRLDDAPFF